MKDIYPYLTCLPYLNIRKGNCNPVYFRLQDSPFRFELKSGYSKYSSLPIKIWRIRFNILKTLFFIIKYKLYFIAYIPRMLGTPDLHPSTRRGKKNRQKEPLFLALLIPFYPADPRPWSWIFFYDRGRLRPLRP